MCAELTGAIRSLSSGVLNPWQNFARHEQIQQEPDYELH